MSASVPPPTNEPIAPERFEQLRGELFRRQLDSEPFDVDAAISSSRTTTSEWSVSRSLAEAKRAGKTLVQPRAGVADLEGQRRLMRALESAGADILPITIDSLTRNLRFAEAADGASRSTPSKSELNGFPIIAHGIDATRELIGSFDRPVHVRANAIDLRLVAEFAFASGATGFVSGPMYATLEYSKDVQLSESIPLWQYVFRLMGRYTESGVPLADDAIGFAQSGTYSVPSLMHAGVVLDALIMAGQGVKHIIPYAMLQGAVAQDIAACLAVERLTEEYLEALGYDDVHVYVAGSDWNGAFPMDPDAAYGLIAVNTFAASVASSPLIYVKSIEEGIGVPSLEGNASSVRMTKYLLHVLAGQAESLRSDDVEFELELNLLEARSILDAVLDEGDGDPVQGAIRGLDRGLIDVPFSPNIYAQGNVLPIRDAAGAVRFLDHGALPIPDAALRLEQERLARRTSEKGAELDYSDIVDDMEFLTAEDLLGIPEGD